MTPASRIAMLDPSRAVLERREETQDARGLEVDILGGDREKCAEETKETKL